MTHLHLATTPTGYVASATTADGCAALARREPLIDRRQVFGKRDKAVGDALRTGRSIDWCLAPATPIEWADVDGLIEAWKWKCGTLTKGGADGN